VDFEDSEDYVDEDYENMQLGRSDIEPYYQQCPMELPPEFAATPEKQVISSPNYPEKYSSDSVCYYVIRPESDNQKIRLTFTDFKLEQGKDLPYNKKKPNAPKVACLYDSVEVRFTDKLKKNSIDRIVNKSKLLENGSRCGKARIRVQDHHSEKRAEKLRQRAVDEGWVYETKKPGQSMVVVFRSDHKKVARGFEAEFESFE